MITFEMGGADVRVRIESEPQNVEIKAGWGQYKRIGIVSIDDKEVFRTKEQIAGGCSSVMQSYNKDLLQECFDWVLANTVR